MSETKFFTIEKAAAYISVSTDTIKRLISSGELPASHINCSQSRHKDYRISVDDLELFMKSRKSWTASHAGLPSVSKRISARKKLPPVIPGSVGSIFLEELARK